MSVSTLPRLANTDAVLPAGEFVARFIGYETRLFFGRSAKVVISWSIVDPGPHFQATVRGFYAVRKLLGMPRRSGKFEIGITSRLARDLARMLEARPPLDRVPIKSLSKGLYLLKCRTVTRDYDQEQIPESIQYAVVDRVVRREE